MVDNNNQKNEPSSVVLLYCRVCKREFNSAGALGGHMRSHGAVGDNSGNRNYGEEISEQKYMMNNFRREKLEGQKHSYNLRTNSNRLMLGNNRSTTDHDHVDVEKSEYYHYGHDVEEKQHCSKEEEEEDLANCLVMLSNKSYDLSGNNNKEAKNKAKEVEKGMFQCKGCKKIFNSHQALGGHRASHKKVKGCYAAKFDDNIKDDDNNNNNNNDDDNDIDEDLMISPSDLILHQESNDFQSQSPTSSSSFSRKRSRVHQCSICHRVFSSGQALGGHKRCHWLTSSLPETTFIPTFQEIQYHNQEQVLYNKPLFINSYQPLDLNFPAQLGNPTEVGLKLHNNPFEHEGPKSQLQLWTDDTDQNNKCKDSLGREENKKANEAKLSNLKDVNLDKDSSSWLQVGIGPTPDILATL